VLGLVRYAYGVSRVMTIAVLGLAVLGSACSVLLTYLMGRVVGLAEAVSDGPWAGFGGLVAGTVVVFLLAATVPVLREAVAVGLEVRLDRAAAAETVGPLVRPRGVSHLEDPDVQDAYARAGEVELVASSRGPACVAALVGSRVMIVGCALLVGSLFAWWVVPVLLASVLMVEWQVGRATKEETVAWAGQTEGQRRARYLFELAMGEGVYELRIFGLSRWLADRHTIEHRSAVQPLWRLRWRSALSRLAVLGVHLVLHAGAVALAVWSAWVGSLSLGAVTAVVPAILAIGMGYDPASVANARRALAGYRAMRRLPELVAQRFAEPAGRPVEVTGLPRSLIRFEGVWFRYPGQDHDVLRGLDLEIRAGEALALVGVNGAGKTTLVKLLAGCIRPTAGRITVDGIVLADLDPRSLATWQRRIAAITQDFVRFPLSAADNIAFGAVDRDRTTATLERAADAAGVAAIIDRLPAGWDTVMDRTFVGGADLSGGQWQRLALARALYAVDAGAGVLVLDEPAAALDVRAEAELVERYLGLTEGVTSLVISHRFSVVRDADRIGVLDSGQIVESGTHDELLALAGRYATMFRLQAGRYTFAGVDDA
jgi:ABC-type multidrug transport system fused ATPase/permease subunit